MHPIELKKKWQLTYDELAQVLGYQGDYTVRSWNRNGCDSLLSESRYPVRT
ncbi:MAG: hypothetical protein KME55_31635 [Nostoc indistinguendum CM1-VF10]|jgi:hypothetical protein|nr:hypothetical protein [Nostoc indistinguendum CM1-VF10]